MVIASRFVEEMVSHARSEVPNEACGLLAIEDGRVVEFHPTRNVAESPVFFEIDSRELLRLTRDIEDRGLDLGIYHSHTHTPARPSPTDIRLAQYPEALYLILSLAQPDAPDLRVYRIADGAVQVEPLEIVSSGGDTS
jgi:proteasome lid subunit RPN8/RPN11